MRRYASVTFSDVKITGPFWTERLDCVLTRTIPSQHAQLAAHGILDSLKLPKPVPPLRIPRNKHNFTTQIFWDSDVGKWIEAAAYALSHRRDAALEAQIESIIDDLEQAQAPDGYLNCWYQEREPDNRWTNLRDNHELYNAGHLLEGAVAYFHATRRDRLLKVMMRYMDHVAATFGPGPGQKRGYCGHQEIELALVKLFHATGIVKYLDLASYFIDERGAQPHYFDLERAARGEPVGAFIQGTYEYSQSHLPVRQQTKVVGHAVRAMYMYTAMADLAAEHDDAGLKRACETLWDDVTRTRMYVTGGFGPSASNEGFTRDYDLPNDTAYAETCASVAFVFWAARMMNLDLDGRYGDLLERALYNNVLAGLSRDGTQYFYDNKLDSDGTQYRWDWHPCPCCTMNVARLIGSVAGYFYGLAEGEIAVHLYGGATSRLPVAGGWVTLSEVSTYPWSGDIALTLEPEDCVRFTLSLRIPAWCPAATAQINGQAVAMIPDKGYLRITRDWAKGDTVTLVLPMRPSRLYANPAVRQDQGRVALRRGPLVYCAEAVDLEVAPQMLRLPAEADLTDIWCADLLGGIITLTAAARKVDTSLWEGVLYRDHPPDERPSPLMAVPYYIWSNRGSNAMQVWLRE